MKYVICKHRKYKCGEVLESTAEVGSVDAVFGTMLRSVLSANADVVSAIKYGITGHHFIDDGIYTYQIVMK